MRTRFDFMQFMLSVPTPAQAEKDITEHIWISIDEDAGIEVSGSLPTDDPWYPYSKYDGALRYLAKYLNARSKLQRFEIEWTVVVEVTPAPAEGESQENCQCCDPRQLQIEFGDSLEDAEDIWRPEDEEEDS